MQYFILFVNSILSKQFTQMFRHADLPCFHLKFWKWHTVIPSNPIWSINEEIFKLLCTVTVFKI